MEPGPLPDGGADGSREKRRWAESKVYTRRIFRKVPNPNQSPISLPPTQDQPTSSQQTPGAAADGVDSSLQKLQAPAPPEDLQLAVPHQSPAASGDDVSSLDPKEVSNHNHSNGLNRTVTINLASKGKQELREMRRKLASELEVVRSLMRRLEAQQLQLSVQNTVNASPPGNNILQPSANEVGAPPLLIKRAPTISEAASATASAPVCHQLAISVPAPAGGYNCIPDVMEKEKRTPKANQYYKNTDFLLWKDRFPPLESNKKSKVNGIKNGVQLAEIKINEQAFKKCEALLSKLMNHNLGWVFNTPVDAEALGLPDYPKIIRNPMDLGTIKSRLSKNWYKSPKEFAEDVRLTFHNAMTYNPKGQDVHIMAQKLLQIFEERWSIIEADLAYLFSSPSMKRPSPFHMKRASEMPETAFNHLAVDFKTKSLNRLTHIARPPASKKPKAKDPNKREMTFEEKQRLSNNLQNLPIEKLDIVVEIIRKKNLSLSQNEDEIEVDIDSVDTETLWELDRFVTNYKKSLSKNKRRAELAMLSKAEHGKHVQYREQRMVADSNPPELLKENMTVGGTRVGEKRSETSSSSSSSSGSGSSSSDSDSESSSGNGSDGAQSPGT